MSELSVINQSKNEPQPVFLKDYQPPVFLIDTIDLHFELNEEDALVTSTMKVRHNRHDTEKNKNLMLNGEELELVSVKLNSKTLSAKEYELTDTLLTIFNVPDNFELEIITKIYPQKNAALSGLYRSGKTFCTQCEAEGFRRITFFMDHPDVLTRYTTTISANESRYPILLSNGNVAASGKLEHGRHWAKWEDPFKKPSYLFALVAGDFDLIEDKFVTQSGRDVVLRIYVEKGYRDQAHHAMYAVKEAMHWDEKAYGREYDLDIYMIVAINDFTMGAMENKGLNIFNTKYVLAKPETATDDDYIHILSVVAHEYFHNWTGNRVTCRDWFQLSLKEGLTIFRDQSFSEDTLSRSVMRIRDVIDLRESQFPEDASPLAHPVRPDSYIEINNFYTATVYNKGAEVLRMLQTILGKLTFRKGMDLYFASYDGMAVTIEDYVRVMEDVSGVDLTQFRRWYSQSGTPIVTVTGEYDVKKKSYTLDIKQHTPPTSQQHEKLPLHIPIKMGLLDQQGAAMPLILDGADMGLETVIHLQQPSQQFVFSNVLSKPVPSLLRNFSAPVKLHYDGTDDELLFLFKHDTDTFNRWEAGQKYAMRMILSLIDDYQHGKLLRINDKFTEIYAHILSQPHDDYFLLAEMLNIPSEKYIGEQMTIVDVDAIHQVRELVLAELAQKLQKIFFDIYHRLHDSSGKYQFSMESVGKRQLKNKCLFYLLLLPQNIAMGVNQFKDSLQLNMTDTLVALTGITNLNTPDRANILKKFYDTWKHDALVLDKWFAIQAACKLPGTLEQIKMLASHEAFDIKNPNKVYSLIGTFGHRNPAQFHDKSGKGYVFLREIVQQLDRLNPQVAGRMVKPLTSWGRYDKERQALMREQLRVILQDKKLSPDLYELITKSL